MRRLMAFIDGTNFLTEMGKTLGVSYSAYNPSEPVIKLAGMILKSLFSRRLTMAVSYKDVHVQRMHWFSSHHGNGETLLQLRTWLRKEGFEPTILPKVKDNPEKGVDIALARESLINAFNRNFEIAMLVSGDQDYLGLVEDLKRFGPLVYGAFFESGLSTDLRLSFDHFEQLSIWGDGHKQLVAEIEQLHGKKQ